MLVTSILLFGLGIFLERTVLHQNQSIRIKDRTERKIREHQSQLKQYIGDVVTTINSDNFSGNLQQDFHYLSDLLDETNMTVLISSGSKITYWSDNKISFDNNYFRTLKEERVHVLDNGFYLSCSETAGQYTIIGLILIKKTYSVQNELMHDHFAKEYRVPDSYRIQLSHLLPGLPVYNVNNEYLFSLIPEGKVLCEPEFLYIASAVFLLALFFLLFYIRLIADSRLNKIHRTSKMLIIFVALAIIYLLHIVYKMPKVWNLLDLFSPASYAYSTYLPSLGDMFLLAIFIFFWCFIFSREMRFMKILTTKRFIIFYTGMALAYLIVNEIISNLIRNSSFSFNLNRMDDIGFYSFMGYLIIVTLIYSVSIVNIRIIDIAPVQMVNRHFIRSHALVFIIFTILSLIFQDSRLYMGCLFFLSGLANAFFTQARIKHTFLSLSVYFVVITTFYALLIIQNHNLARQRQIQELLAEIVYSENDPAMEIILTEINQELVEDTFIQELLEPPYIQAQEYLERQYFSGYPRKYDIQVTVCQRDDNLHIYPEDKDVPCLPFFDEQVRMYGTRINNTNFYYMDRMNGRISYFGKFVHRVNGTQTVIFIELQSRLSPEGAGFPKLLLDQNQAASNRAVRYKHFSYAKYHEARLVFLSGDYSYDYIIQPYLSGSDTTKFIVKKLNNYDHLIYNIGEESYIIVSTPSFEFLDYLVSFPYLFALFAIFLISLIFITNPTARSFNFSRNLRFKIQIAIISAVFLSLFIVAGGVIYYNSKESINRHHRNLNEKMGSIAEEVNIRLYEIDNFDNEVINWLRNELGNLSNIFRTDINIYGSDGRIIVSSRPEIFNRGIISRLMDSRAFFQLNENYHLKFMQPEQIGKQKFMSIYEPIYNNEGVILGFINLPYFSQGDELRQEISTFIVAFINIYLLLFFASIILAVLLADKITSPLSLIREKLKGIQLTHRNEQIEYESNDEIGELIKEYNRKVEELDDSAELLAQNEREVAWREMARQVAHEIKNPLTPMKLNIQHLQRAKEERDSRYDDLFDRVTKTLVEQIETLSNIATGFSNFAQIPTAKSEAFNIVEVLKKSITLFEGNQASIVLNLNGLDEVFIIADHEQLSRMLINLIKNAIQSIPADRKGIIEVELATTDTDTIISIKDNGSGIPREVRKRMFQPNFTTKTSGMGLGLAIVRKIVETFHGRIWYETELDKGTTFHVKFPLTTLPLIEDLELF